MNQDSLNEEKFLKEIAWGVLASTIGWTEPTFETFYGTLDSDAKPKFLRLCHFYQFYVRGLDGARDDTRDSYAFLAFFCLVEALMEEDGHKSFEVWLPSVRTFPIRIENGDELNKLKDKYYAQHGAGRRAKVFFSKYVDFEDKVAFVANFQILRRRADDDYKRIDELNWQTSRSASTLARMIGRRVGLAYDFRSKFVHSALSICLCPKGFEASGFFWNDDKYHIMISLSADDFLKLGMRGLLRYFGYDGKFKYSAYKSWLDGELASHRIPDDEYNAEITRLA